jgi:hypothetical protein
MKIFSYLIQFRIVFIILIFYTRLPDVKRDFKNLYYVNEYLRYFSVYVLRIRVVIVIVFFQPRMDMYVIEKIKDTNFDQYILFYKRGKMLF